MLLGSLSLLSFKSLPSHSPTMASKGAVLPLLRREIRSSARFSRASPSVSALSSARTPANLFLTSARRSTRRSTPFTPLQTRAFSQSVSRRFTDENGSFDPRSLERESDEVDVCIVGGGMCCIREEPPPNDGLTQVRSFRSRRSRRRNSVEAACERSRQ